MIVLYTNKPAIPWLSAHLVKHTKNVLVTDWFCKILYLTAAKVGLSSLLVTRDWLTLVLKCGKLVE